MALGNRVSYHAFVLEIYSMGLKDSSYDILGRHQS